MAVVTRWFSTVAAGTGDGTSWANRAQLVNGATWSSVITGFSFAGSDSLECRVGPGTYAYTATLTNALFANPPTRSNRIYIVGSDSSGSPIQPFGWSSAEPTYPSSSYPLFTSSSGVGLFNMVSLSVAFIKAVVSSNGSVVSAPVVTYCDIENTANNSAASCFVLTRNSMYIAHNRMKCSGTAYNVVMDLSASGMAYVGNCRLEGNPSATSGGRRGLTASSWQPFNKYERLTIVNHPGIAVVINAGDTRWYGEPFTNSVISNNGNGIYIDPNAALAIELPVSFSGNMITGNAAYGVQFGTNNGEVWLLNNRFRNNGTADYDALINVPFTSNYTAQEPMPMNSWML